jgi:hypothetical protein
MQILNKFLILYYNRNPKNYLKLKKFKINIKYIEIIIEIL